MPARYKAMDGIGRCLEDGFPCKSGDIKENFVRSAAGSDHSFPAFTVS